MFLEDALDLPLWQVLPQMQERMTGRTRYFGVQALKNPLDFWVYQELLYHLQPDVIVEIGNRFGGSTLALAHLCELIGKGKVIGLDINHRDVSDLVRNHRLITLIEGDACASFPRVRDLVKENDEVFVIEDSSHTYENTLNVLRTYCGLVKPRGYFVVEDGICHHGLEVGPYPGPYEAVKRFVAENSDFVIDRGREDFVITWNPKGFLYRSN